MLNNPVLFSSAGSGSFQVESGHYTGTGTYGSSNKSKLTFGFVPKLVIICSDTGSGSAVQSGMFVIESESGAHHSGMYMGTSGSGSGIIGLSTDLDGTTLSWYGASASVQLNVNKLYFYTAIG